MNPVQPLTSAPSTSSEGPIDFAREPATYRHLKLEFDGAVATIGIDIDEAAPLRPGYELKLNSYDLGVDIELYDAIQRLRFEHPEVRVVVMRSLKERVFCAGANIRMLGQSSHGHKVNFCKFTNETRIGIEDASEHSQQRYVAAIRGSCAGGGYELALACDYILMADDGATAVSLPEMPLLAVLPGTGGLSRLVDKRHVRRDHADFFCTLEEGIRGQRAVDWRLVDELAPASRFDQALADRVATLAAESDRPVDAGGVKLEPLARSITAEGIAYTHVRVAIDRDARTATLTVSAPTTPQPQTPATIASSGCDYWPLAVARELDDTILHLRFNEPEIGTWVLRTEGDAAAVLAVDEVLAGNQDDWLVRECLLYLKRVFKRLDVSARSLIATVEPGSCFAGSLLELALASDQAYMLDGQFEDDETPAATLTLGPLNFGAYPMPTGITRLQTRFLSDPAHVDVLHGRIGEALDAGEALALGLVTFAPDDIDWEEEVRITLEARASFSPDALTGMEANLRFPGPETMESKIFARLTAWQNWIFQRPNAVGDKGALVLYGSGQRPDYDRRRV